MEARYLARKLPLAKSNFKIGFCVSFCLWTLKFSFVGPCVEGRDVVEVEGVKFGRVVRISPNRRCVSFKITVVYVIDRDTKRVRISEISQVARAPEISHLTADHVTPSAHISGDFSGVRHFSEMSDATDN